MYYKNNRYHLADKEVTYIDTDISGEEITKPTGRSENEWNNLADMHDSITIVGFDELTHADEELARLEEVNELSLGDGFGGVVSDYVYNGEFPDEPNHVLKDLETSLLKTVNKQLKQQLVAQSQVSDFQEEAIVELAMQVYR